jgi:hypothetical protein
MAIGRLEQRQDQASERLERAQELLAQRQQDLDVHTGGAHQRCHLLPQRIQVLAMGGEELLELIEHQHHGPAVRARDELHELEQRRRAGRRRRHAQIGGDFGQRLLES